MSFRYPQGVRVTSTVVIEGAHSLIVSFDPRSKTEANADYLMFSRLCVGGDELGVFSGEVREKYRNFLDPSFSFQQRILKY
jgi:hypothetical protein